METILVSCWIIHIKLWGWVHCQTVVQFVHTVWVTLRMWQDDTFYMRSPTDWLWSHLEGGKGDGEPGCRLEGVVPRENARTCHKDPSVAAELDGAGEDCGGEQVTSARVCAAPGLLQELPRDDVSGAWGLYDPFLGQTFFHNPLFENICPLQPSFQGKNRMFLLSSTGPWWNV